MDQHTFGGNWTEDKLERVRRYLEAYTQVMKDQPFRTAYIDAFAGTGYRTAVRELATAEPLFPEFAEEDTQLFLDGSARIALGIRPRFSKYIFVERSAARFRQLADLKVAFPDLQDDIILERRNANEYLRKMCRADWLATNGRIQVCGEKVARHRILGYPFLNLGQILERSNLYDVVSAENYIGSR